MGTQKPDVDGLLRQLLLVDQRAAVVVDEARRDASIILEEGRKVALGIEAELDAKLERELDLLRQETKVVLEQKHREALNSLQEMLRSIEAIATNQFDSAVREVIETIAYPITHPSYDQS